MKTAQWPLPHLHDRCAVRKNCQQSFEYDELAMQPDLLFLTQDPGSRIRHEVLPSADTSDNGIRDSLLIFMKRFGK